jgi:predicted metal-dependent hydrolase
MAQKTVFVPEIGEIILSKRKGATSLRLSVNAAGKIRVGMPYWTPYQTGISFAKSKSDWIKTHLASQANTRLKHNDLIGKSHRINYIFTERQTIIKTRVKTNEIMVATGLSLNDMRVQKSLVAACEKALKSEAEHLLPQRLRTLAVRYEFDYESVSVRKLTGRWGSCSNIKAITLSYYLVQLPWDLIDYVLLHELVHTKHLHHGKGFWDEFKRTLPNARQMQKEIRPYKPLVQAYHIIPSEQDA